ncbi:MAG: rod shape-determining protein [Clostridia bacterium]|nr:rod shape-determining protein [Clostridia bacterium]
MGTIMLAIKMGTKTTTIYKQNDGFLLKEPSLVAINGASRDKEVCAVGLEAKKLYGKLGEESLTTVVSPINEGVITDSELATKMLKMFIEKICPRKLFKPNIRAIVCVPLGITLAEKLVFEQTCYHAGINDVILIPSIICSAIGYGTDISSDATNMFVGVGGGCTDIAVISQTMLINGINVGMGGGNIDKAIEQQLIAKFNFIVGDSSAEKIKKEIGSLYATDSNEVLVSGQDAITREAKKQIIVSSDIYPAVEHYYAKIADSIVSVLNTCSPEVCAEIAKRGITFVGGDSKITGLEKYFKTKLNIPVRGTDNAEDLDIVGCAELLDNPDLLKKVLINI